MPDNIYSECAILRLATKAAVSTPLPVGSRLEHPIKARFWI
jgi:hypothetical protein